MRKELCSFTFILSACLFGLEALPTGQGISSFEKTCELHPSAIQVLIEKEATEALLEVKGPYYLFDPQDGSRVAAGLLGKRFMARELSAGLKWGEEFPGIHQLYIKPRSSETSIFVNGIQYSGGVYLYGVEGKLNIVNEIDIESYVKSILTSQFPTPMEPEVMASLAIVARTNAYHQALKSKEGYWQVEAKAEEYMGSALIVSHSPIERAVDSTKHLVLVHPSEGKNMPFAASWTEHSAGKTATYEAIFRKEANAPEKGVEAPHALLSRQDAKWSYQISKRKFCSLMNLTDVTGCEVFVDAPSGKVYAIRVKESKESYDFDFLTLQEKLGKDNLPSSDFSLSLKEDSILFTGYGKGHGVGLCLYSASALAQNGENALKILAKFFPDTYLHNLGTSSKL